MTLTVTDLFCGGGGSSTGMVDVPGVEIRIAANHWDLAVSVHQENHQDADHAAADLHEEDPAYFPRTDILWASPECTKWSQASGGKYASVSTETDLLDLLNPDLVEEDPATAIVQRSRLLMFDVLRFAAHHQYRAMVIENVVDIATNPKFAEAWQLWKQQLRNLGYNFRVVSLNSMHAQAHGDPAPQSRDRLYIVCWRRGDRAPDIDAVLRPLAWCPRCSSVVEAQQVWKNNRTVGKYRSQYIYVHGSCSTPVEPGYLPAAAAIDWTLPGTRIGDRTKDLAEKTRRRIAAGIARYWGPVHIEAAGNTYDAANPNHPAYRQPNGYYRAWSTHDVLRTLHTDESKALVVPLEGRAGDRCSSSATPLHTQTSRHLDALVAPPFIAELRGGGSDARSTERPLSTVTASGNHHALVMRNNGERGGHPARHTTPADEYLRTLTANGPLPSLLTPYYGTSKSAQTVDEPVGTLTTHDRYGLVMTNNHQNRSRETTEALPTLTTATVHALIQRHNSSPGDGAEMITPAKEPLRTLTTSGHQSLLTPGDIAAAEAQVDDCLFRMLEPHEVAAGMAFPADYLWQGTRRERVKLAGNAVTPPAARDLIAAVAHALVGAA